MNSDYLKIYLDDTLRLAKTLVVKSQDAVEGINEQIRIMYGQSAVDDYDPGSWKYYQNICGEYHKTQMIYGRPSVFVTSLDTLEVIEFTKENLEQHVATKNAYQFGTRYYYNLLKNYPDYEQLFLGILYPANKEEAIAAEPGTILAYPENLVEPQELSFIKNLEAWIKNYLARWHVRGFAVTDSLYPAAHHAIMYLNMVPKMLNLRLRKCKTEEAHSFHIRHYLSSHGRLDEFMDNMTLKQKLFLYRNIMYIEKKAGHRDTFKWLMEKLLTDRYIPLAEYSARCKTDFTEDYYPELIFRRKPINLPINGPEKELFQLQELLNKELPSAYYNEMYSANHVKRIGFDFITSKSSITQTKVLDSVVFDYANSGVYSRADVLLQHWAEMSATGKYTSQITFRDPATGIVRTLSCSKAFVYFMYAMLKSFGFKTTIIPSFRYNRVLRTDNITVDELAGLGSKMFVERFSKAEDILNARPLVSTKISTESFFDMVNNIHDFSVRQWRDVSQTENMYRRAEVQNMYSRLYKHGWVTFGGTLYPDGTPMTFSKWLQGEGIPEDSYTEEQYLQLATEIFSTSTGLSTDNKQMMVNVQKSMISIMKRLSSYSVQFLYNTNSTPLKFINWPAVRLGDVNNYYRTWAFLQMPSIVNSFSSRETEAASATTSAVSLASTSQTVEQSSYLFKNNTTIQSNADSASSFNYTPTNSGPTTVSETNYQASYQTSSGYQSLSDAEKLALTDIYGNADGSANLSN